ncbi:MAG: ATP-binding cassette domain-containing protein [Alphaproteobacteria bacterium]|nr:ATP-binding cassette domain-containing protein [Alphaproteobacteria bacterium]
MMTTDRENALEIDGLVVEYGARRGLIDAALGRTARLVRAVDGVSLAVRRNETVGLVGESGCGKTTLGRAIMRILDPTAGSIRLGGVDLLGLRGGDLRAMRRRAQMVFQDPYSSLNPRMTVEQMLAEVLRFHRVFPDVEIRGRVAALLELVGLAPELAGRRPKTLSGGQRQRVGLARALALEPTFLVLDEPVAALDVSIQAQILNLLVDLRDRLGLAMLFIAHELSVVRHMSHRVAVMYLGRIVEVGTAEDVFERPAHPYTQSLVRAIPRLVPERRHRKPVLQGEVPSPLDIPTGCRFHTRCPKAQDRCTQVAPVEQALSASHQVECHFPDAS